jgi:uncharacterized repeat protein (TIGR03803 family)
MVTDTRQQRISKVRLGAARSALTFVVVLGLGVVVSQSAQAQTLAVLYNFTGGADGGLPYAGVVRDTAGNLYGTTYEGGSSNYGTVFKVDTSGTETVLYNFTGGADGRYPSAGLIQDKAGNLYGTTEYGGDFTSGTVFKVDTVGTETVLHSFGNESGSDGLNPVGGLVLDKAGNLYGTTYDGGSCAVKENRAPCTADYGTVFKVDTSGTETLLHSFGGAPKDGANPSYTSLLMDKTGDLYGVTQDGGPHNGGVVYKLSTSGKLTVLHSFTGRTKDGYYGHGTPAMDTKGNLYGTTEAGGFYDAGTVWKVSKKGKETVLHNFAGRGSHGGWPFAGVIMDKTGNLYGVTEGGGSHNAGVVYKLSAKGKLTLLHSFAVTDGEYPYGGLVRDVKGTLYGTTVKGGSGSYGTVWKLTP